MRSYVSGDEGAESIGDIRDGVRQSQEVLETYWMRKARREPGAKFLVGERLKFCVGLSREAFHQEDLVVLQMNQQRGVRVLAQVFERELPDIFAWCPHVHDVSGASVREDRLSLEQPVEGGGSEQGRRNNGNGFQVIRNRYHACVPQPGQAVREGADVVQAITGEVAVVDEKYVHAWR